MPALRAVKVEPWFSAFDNQNTSRGAGDVTLVQTEAVNCGPFDVVIN